MSKLKLFIIQVNNNDLTRFPNMNEYAEDFNYNWQRYVNYESTRKEALLILIS